MTMRVYHRKTITQKMPSTVSCSQLRNEPAYEEEVIATTDRTTAVTTVRAGATCGGRTVDVSGWGCSRNGAKNRPLDETTGEISSSPRTDYFLREAATLLEIFP